MKYQLNRGFLTAIMTLCAACFLPSKVCAQESETEKRFLITISTELENVKALAKKAESTADDRDRVHFDYVALQGDLQAMQAAIEQHIKEPSRSPRKIAELTNQYSKTANDE